MNKKGFTLIELLAVIVILAIIALIATPIILNVIETAKKGAAKSSALGYLNAVENQAVINSVDTSKEDIIDGIYYISDIDVSYKGKGPIQGELVIEDLSVKSARLCIDNYSINFSDEEINFVENDYCSTDFEITLDIDGMKENKKIGTNKETTFELIDISDMTNISCNNGAVPTIEGNALKITNVFGNTKCVINETLEKTINNLDSTETNIVMLSDEEVSNTLAVQKNNNVVLDLNGKIISTNKIFIYNYGKMIVNDTIGSGKIITAFQALNNSGEKELIVNGGTFERNSGTGAVVYNQGNGTIIINNGKFISVAGGIQNNVKDGDAIGNIIINNGYFESESNLVLANNNSGKITVKGGVFISNERGVSNYTGTINIIQTNTPVYITSLAQTWKPAVINSSTGVINIKGNLADKCTNDYTNTTSGICIYAEGDKNFTTDTANTAICNTGDGIINIDGGTIYGGYYGISNHFDGKINILNANISSGNFSIANMRTATTNICNSNITSSKYDLYATSNTTTGTINYSSNVIFTSKNNTPSIGGIGNSIVSNYTGTCNAEA